MKALERLRHLATRAASRAEMRRATTEQTTAADLEHWARSHLGSTPLVIVSNREPYSHVDTADGVRIVRNAGGLTVALDAIAGATGGAWVAHGSGSADRGSVDEKDRVGCPPGSPRYALRRVWLTPEDHDLYYAGFSNSALWPLCHIAYVRPRFERAAWDRYQDVNRRFAEAVLDEIGTGPAVVFLQDYHLALAASTLRQHRPDLRIALFWHIPWPNAEAFRRLPWRKELLEGLLACDLLGFHIHQHALNFLQSVGDTLEARVDRERLAVQLGGRRTWVRAYPIGVDTGGIATLTATSRVRAAAAALRARHAPGDGRLMLGVDRLDYTKGVPERLLAVERLLERRPEWRGRLRFAQIAVPSRIELEEYRAVHDRAVEIAARINARFGDGGPPPVHLVVEHLDFVDLLPWYVAADLCVVTSLHDGMNLVAKEFVAAAPDLDRGLVLSPFTGSARELEGAWISSPYDCDGLADTFHEALVATPAERRRRMESMKAAVRRRTVFDWAIDVLDGACALPGPPPVGPPARARRPRSVDSP